MSETDLTPGELEVDRINRERQAEIERGERSPRGLLKGAAARAHAEKINRVYGIATPLTRHFSSEDDPTVLLQHSKHPYHTKLNRGKSSERMTQGITSHIGDPSKCDDPSKDTIPAQFGGHMLTGGAAAAHEAALHRQASREKSSAVEPVASHVEQKGGEQQGIGAQTATRQQSAAISQASKSETGPTPGEKDTAALNEQRIPFVSLRGASAAAHTAKVNRLKTGDPTGHPHSEIYSQGSTATAHQIGHTHDPSLVCTCPFAHKGDPDASKCPNPELDNVPAQFGGHLLVGGPAVAHIEKWNREHPDRPAEVTQPRYLVDDSEVKDDDPEVKELEINNSVQCDRCGKWRRVSPETFNLYSSDRTRPFYCEMNEFDPNYASCEAPQDERAMEGTVTQQHH